MNRRMLTVPFVSRFDADGARLDCGACCAAMLLGAMAQAASAAEIAAAAEVDLAPGRTGCRLSPSALIRGAAAFELTLFKAAGYTFEDLKRLVDDGQPPIALLRYGEIPDRLERRCTAEHYVAVVGYDDETAEIFINDPHYPEASGGYRRAYSYPVFMAAWSALGNVLLVPAPVATSMLAKAPAFQPPDAAAPRGAVGDLWVIAPVGLRVRSAPDAQAGAVAATVTFGQHVLALGAETAVDSKTYTWQQIQTDYGAQGWVAASMGGTRYLAEQPPVEPYPLYVLNTALAQQAGGLNVRESRDVQAALRESVPIGGRLVIYGRVTEVDGTPWLWVKTPGEKFGWAREQAEGVMLVGPAEVEELNRYGININPYPTGAHRPLTVEELQQGVGWVRFVFAQGEVMSPQTCGMSDAQSFAHYDAVVDFYRAAGTESLMILNWQSFWGHGPWDNGDWPRYVSDFGDYVRKVAQHFKGRVTAYQIWNEGDHLEGHGTSIYIKPETYAPILHAAGRAIKEVDPDAKVVFGGVCGGPEGNVNYVQQTRAAMQGEWPVDAIGMHPYGRYPASIQTGIPCLGNFGTLEQYLDIVTQSLPDPIWITEIGVPSDDVNWADYTTQDWDGIAHYLREVYKVAQRYRERVPIVFWFAWSNKMRGSGIVDSHDNPKGPIYDAFFKVVRGVA